MKITPIKPNPWIDFGEIPVGSWFEVKNVNETIYFRTDTAKVAVFTEDGGSRVSNFELDGAPLECRIIEIEEIKFRRP